MIDWRSLRGGDTAYACVTDHPRFPRRFHAGDYGMFRDRDTAERIATAWNSFGETEWIFYVKEVVLLPPRDHDPADDWNQEVLW